MSKIVLIAIVAIIIVVLLGLYFIFLNSSKDAPDLQNQAANSDSAAQRTFQAEGVQVQVLKEGSGAEVKDGDSVTVHYVGTLADGTQFDSSIDKNRPYTFTLGRHSVPRGYEIGVLGMKVGEKRKITVPPELGYGSEGFITIPPNATLIFEVEMLKIN